MSILPVLELDKAIARCRKPEEKEKLFALKAEDICDTPEQGCQGWLGKELKS